MYHRKFEPYRKLNDFLLSHTNQELEAYCERLPSVHNRDIAYMFPRKLWLSAQDLY